MDDFSKKLGEWLNKIIKPIDPKLKFSLKQPWDALKLLAKLNLENEDIQGQIESGVKWDVPIVIGKGSLIRFPTRIEGPVIIGENTVIGPYAFIRGPTVIGNDCRIGSTEVKNAIIMDKTYASHFSYVGDSIIGKSCNLGAGAKLANLRLDRGKVKVTIGEKTVSSGLDKLGAILEDHVAIGCNAVLNPGTYVAKKGVVIPNASVKGFIK